jgi:hypothetical protein
MEAALMHTSSDLSEGNTSSQLDPISMSAISDALDQPSKTASVHEAATAVFTTNELLYQILLHIPREQLITVRRVSATWNKVASKIGYHIVPYTPAEDRVHEHPTPHYPASVAVKIHPVFKKALVEASYVRIPHPNKKPTRRMPEDYQSSPAPVHILQATLHKSTTPSTGIFHSPAHHEDYTGLWFALQHGDSQGTSGSPNWEPGGHDSQDSPPRAHRAWPPVPNQPARASRVAQYL